MYAVFQLAGKQFSVEEGAVVHVPLQSVQKGATMDIDQILLVKQGDNTLVGTPYVDGAKIVAEVIDHGRSEKVEVYKYKRRTKYRRRQGHRQPYSTLKISKIIPPTP